MSVSENCIRSASLFIWGSWTLLTWVLPAANKALDGEEGSGLVSTKRSAGLVSWVVEGTGWSDCFSLSSSFFSSSSLRLETVKTFGEGIDSVWIQSGLTAWVDFFFDVLEGLEVFFHTNISGSESWTEPDKVSQMFDSPESLWKSYVQRMIDQPLDVSSSFPPSI